MDDIFPPLTPEILVPRIGEYLVEKGLISSEDLLSALELQQVQKQGQSFPPLLGQILVVLGKISPQELDLAITELIIQLRLALQSSNQALEKRVKDRTSQLEDALNRLEEASQAKNNFIANISHELRTPLTHIIGCLNLMTGQDLGSLSEEQQEVMQIMTRATSRLEQLIEDLILFSDSQKEDFSLQITSFSMHNLGVRLVERIKSRAKDKKIEIMFTCDPAIPEAKADEDKISWVISHLLENAIKFTPEAGKISLEIAPAGKILHIAVKDTGIGIPQDRINEIFLPFHQLDASSTRKYGGTGLGLSLAKKIVEAHGSVLKVTSQVNKGSIFEFFINTNQSSGTITNWLKNDKE